MAVEDGEIAKIARLLPDMSNEQLSLVKNAIDHIFFERFLNSEINIDIENASETIEIMSPKLLEAIDANMQRIQNSLKELEKINKDKYSNEGNT